MILRRSDRARSDHDRLDHDRSDHARPDHARSDRPRTRLLGVVALLAALTLVATACDPAPAPGPPSPDPTRVITFKGLGAWWDVYDWSPTFTNDRQALGLSDVDRLANAGVQTLYIQTATYRRSDYVMLDRALLRKILDRAHAHGIRVVGWYLPEFNDVDFDLARLMAIADFGFDGVGIDIESTANGDVAARTRNLITESAFMRGVYPNLPLAAIPVTPIIWEELNRSWWPNFPYRELAQYYDAWMPMAYWSYRAKTFTEWNDPYRYVYESVVRLRTLTGNPNLPVHPIGGEAAGMTTSDVFWMNAAMNDSNSIGGSIYDDASSPRVLYDALPLFRRELVK